MCFHNNCQDVKYLQKLWTLFVRGEHACRLYSPRRCCARRPSLRLWRKEGYRLMFLSFLNPLCGAAGERVVERSDDRVSRFIMLSLTPLQTIGRIIKFIIHFNHMTTCNGLADAKAIM